MKHFLLLALVVVCLSLGSVNSECIHYIVSGDTLSALASCTHARGFCCPGNYPELGLRNDFNTSLSIAIGQPFVIPDTCTCLTNSSCDLAAKLCNDIDECAPTSNVTKRFVAHCTGMAVCVNTPYHFKCQCPPGYKGAGPVVCTNFANKISPWCTTTDCTDLNECVDGGSLCSVNANCINTVGNYTCECKLGFTGDGFTYQDVNECEATPGPCDLNAACVNTEGSFNCTCNPGYAGDGISCVALCGNGVVDPDETCDSGAHCNNATCQCLPGFQDDAQSTGCVDINECIGVNDCSIDADCANVVGNYTCTCKRGYSGDGFTCADIDECRTNTDNCDTHATCSNTPGSFTCECTAGYQGNGVVCTAIPTQDTQATHATVQPTQATQATEASQPATVPPSESPSASEGSEPSESDPEMSGASDNVLAWLMPVVVACACVLIQC